LFDIKLIFYQAFTAFEKLFLPDFVFTFKSSVKSRTMGVAINIEEYVPTTIPTNKANAKPLILPPPNKKSIKITNKVVNEVTIVLLKVELIARFNTSSFALSVYMPKYSLTRSKTITVSLIEYPMTVNKAAMKAWSISSEKGNTP